MDETCSTNKVEEEHVWIIDGKARGKEAATESKT
jgi:hypothetical protein